MGAISNYYKILFPSNLYISSCWLRIRLLIKIMKTGLIIFNASGHSFLNIQIGRLKNWISAEWGFHWKNFWHLTVLPSRNICTSCLFSWMTQSAHPVCKSKRDGSSVWHLSAYTYTYYSSYTHTNTYWCSSLSLCTFICTPPFSVFLSLFSSGKLKGSTNKSDYEITQTFNPPSSFHLHAFAPIFFIFYFLFLFLLYSWDTVFYTNDPHTRFSNKKNVQVCFILKLICFVQLFLVWYIASFSFF